MNSLRFASFDERLPAEKASLSIGLYDLRWSAGANEDRDDFNVLVNVFSEFRFATDVAGAF